MTRCVAACVAGLLACGSGLRAAAPVFVPIRIDGPRHDPAQGSFWYGPFSEGSAVIDIDGDGVLDITCGANWYQAPNWVKHEGYRPGAGVVGEYVDNNGEVALDVDGDGDLDLVSAGWMSNGIWWFENPGRVLPAGEQWRATKIHPSDWTEGFLVRDVDGDGDPDILINHWEPKEGQALTWLELERPARFVPHALGTKGDGHGMGFGDLNGDGRGDILTAEGWYEAPEDRRAGIWTFHADYQIEEHASLPMIVHDVNGDGRNDIIYGNAHGYGFFWMEQKEAGGSRAFTRHVITEEHGQFHAPVLADIDQDGVLDLVAGKRLRGHNGDDPSAFDPLCVFWYEIKGGAFVAHVLSYNHLPWYPGTEVRNPVPNCAIGAGMGINVADMNGDGRVDLVMSGKSGLYMFENRGVPPTKRMDGK